MKSSRRSRWLRLSEVAGLSLILLALTSSCAKKEPDVIRIGSVFPLTGEGAPYGQSIMKAIDMAVEEINNQGGIKGRKLQVIHEDSKMLPRDAASAVSKLATIDKVVGIIGPFTSTESHSALPILNQHKVVAISPSSTDNKLSIPNDFFFRTIVPDAHEGAVMAEFAYNKMRYRKMAILYIESAGPAGVSETFRKKFMDLGGDIVTVEKGTLNSTDFRTQLTRIKAKEPEAIYIAGIALETGTILKQAKELGIRQQFLAHEPAEDPQVRAIAGNAADGVIFATSKLDPESGDEATKKFYEKFRSKYGEDPGSYAANAYDAVHLLAQAIEKHDDQPASILTGLLEIDDYPGAAGRITFEPNGDVVLPLKIMTIHNGEIRQYSRER
ncbi:MAG: ABC transporter substrate-binding protein [Nitrososphaerales archaeon]